MRVAVAQFSATLDKAANLDHITALAGEAAGGGAQLVVLPEAAMCDFGQESDDLHSRAEPLDGPFVKALTRLAARHRIAIAAGMFEAIPGDHLIHNTVVLVDPGSGLVGTFRKLHLYDALGDLESRRLRPGLEEPEIYEIRGFKVAMVVCYDLRFPQLIASVADRGAELLLVPAAWVAGPLKEEHWTVLTQARAIENTMYVAGAGQVGTGYCGRSVVIDPFGVKLASLGESEAVGFADVSRERLEAVRAKLPLLRQRARRPSARLM